MSEINDLWREVRALRDRVTALETTCEVCDALRATRCRDDSCTLLPGHAGLHRDACDVQWGRADDQQPRTAVTPVRECTCLGSCRGAEGLAPGWKCALQKESRAAVPVERGACGCGHEPHFHGRDQGCRRMAEWGSRKCPCTWDGTARPPKACGCGHPAEAHIDVGCEELVETAAGRDVCPCSWGGGR